MAITTAVPTSYKKELMTATHNHTASTGDDFKMALIKNSPAGTYGAATTNYSDVTGNSDEVSGTGYSSGGYDLTAANNITPSTSGTTAFTSWNVSPSWTGATFTARGCVIYNASKSNKAAYVGDFGADEAVVAGTLTVVFPTNDASNAILRISS